MARPVLEQWSGDRLVYVSPRQTCRTLGYPGPGERDDVTERELAYFGEIDGRVPLQDGVPAREPRPFATPDEAREAIGRLARDLGADVVGVADVDARYVYDGADVPHRHAIVVGVAMDYDEILALPRPETNAEYLRAYAAASRVAVELAVEIRGRGYPALAHTLRGEGIAMLPHAQAAGLGTLGKHGSLINRELGCCFRLAAVTTDLPLTLDAPRDEGIEDFCASCRMCVSYCPGDAISDERDVVRGVERWVVDTEACVPYFSTHYGCAVCIQVCPLNAKAFGGVSRDAYVSTMKGLDAGDLRERLTAALPGPRETAGAEDRP